MSHFEEYLVSIGYIRHVFGKCDNDWQWVPDKHQYRAFSSYSPVTYCYKKEECTTIHYGLNEKGYPPTLVWPIPRFPEIEEVMKKEKHIIGDGAYMTRILATYTPEQIVQAL